MTQYCPNRDKFRPEKEGVDWAWCEAKPQAEETTLIIVGNDDDKPRGRRVPNPKEVNVY
jgi:hypothetical protein